jgi:hypothetical protein
MLWLAACSDYALESAPEKPEREPRDRPEDTVTDTTDTAPPPDTAPPEDTAPPPDDTGEPLEEAYCTPFDDFSGWSYTGTGSWHIEEGLLTEGRSGGYAGVAYLSDLGRADSFMIQVDTAWTATANDLTGLAWAVSGERYYVVRWDDPQDYYNRHDPTGAMDLSFCDGGTCTTLAFDSSADLYWPEDKTFVTWSVTVTGDYLEVVVGNTPALSATVPEIAGTGPGVVGLYSNDNDGGVWFDDFCVWVGG